tara:strand:- start:3414 stop:3662 length:249 start_codon:yes stop_codon:yes gene_type:complete
MTAAQQAAFQHATNGTTAFQYGLVLNTIVGILALVIAGTLLMGFWSKKRSKMKELGIDEALLQTIGVFGLIALIAILIYIQP